MIARLITFLLLVGVLAGVVWYLFQETPERKVREWRQYSVSYLQQGDLDIAREFNDAVLELIPGSIEDTYLRAIIVERFGTRDGLLQALETYERLFDETNGTALALQLDQARVYRKLGGFFKARGKALSVIDALPFEATMELGMIALERVSPDEAIRLFQKARGEFSETEHDDLAMARVLGSLAAGYKQKLLVLEEIRARDDATASEVEEIESFVDENQRDLERAYSLTLKLTLDQLEAALDYDNLPRLANWYAALAIEHARSMNGEADTCTEAVKSLRTRTDSHMEVDPKVRLAIGSLLLHSTWLDRGRIGDPASAARDRSTAEAELEAVLEEVSREEARELFSLPWSEDRAAILAGEESDQQIRRRRYILNLLDVAKVYLSSPQPREVTESATPFELRERIADARAIQQKAGVDTRAARDVSAVFSAVVGFAELKLGNLEAANQAFGDYIESNTTDPGAARIEVAEQVVRLLPDSTVVFEYLDAAAGSEDLTPLDYLTRRLRLLLTARRSDALAEGADRRIDELLDSASQAAGSAQEPSSRFVVARLVRSVRGLGPAIADLERAVRAQPKDDELRLLLGEYRVEYGRSLAKAEASEEAAADPSAPSSTAVLQSALALYVSLYIEDPIAHPHVALTARGLFAALDDPGALDDLAGELRGAYESLGARDSRSLALALRDYFLGEHAAALDRMRSIAPLAPDAANAAASLAPLRKFASYLRGTAHLELASAEAEAGSRSGARERAAERIQQAAGEFLAFRDYLPNEIELLGLELRGESVDPVLAKLPPAERLASLTTRIRTLAEDTSAGHHGPWLLSRALASRYDARKAAGAGVKELTGILDELRRSLRETLQRFPDHVPAYLRLASSFLIDPRRNEISDLEKDVDQAIRLLKAVPRATATVHAALGSYLEHNKRPDEALTYHLAAFLSNPSPTGLRRLAANRIETRNYEDVRTLLGDEVPTRASDGQGDEADEDVVALSADEREFYDMLIGLMRNGRISVEPAVLYSLCAAVLGQIEVTSTNPDAKSPTRFRQALLLAARTVARQPTWWSRALRYELLGDFHSEIISDRTSLSGGNLVERVVALYNGAVDEYRSQGREVPLNVLNNAAWYIASTENIETHAHIPGFDYARALDLATTAYERVKDEPAEYASIHDTYAFALYRAGRPADAREVLDRLVLEAKTPKASYHYRLALAFYALDDANGALDELRKAESTGGEFPERTDADRLRRRIEGSMSNPERASN